MGAVVGGPLTARSITVLQRAAGNAAVSQLVASGGNGHASSRGPVPTVQRSTGVVVQRGVNESQVALEQSDDHDFVAKLREMKNNSAVIDDADVGRLRRRIDAVKARHVFVPGSVEAMIDLYATDVEGDGPKASGYQKAQQAFANVDPKKRRKDESRGAYLGAGDAITAKQEEGHRQSPEKGKRRDEKVLDLKGEWSWAANEEWVNQADKTFGRFKLLADQIPDWARSILSSPDATGDRFLATVHEHYKDATERVDLYHTADGENRFTYFAQELAKLLDMGYRLHESGGKLIMMKSAAQ
ncbi:hypothetical protein [Streptomyces sp. MH13]|uniref:hypothetical protein n=1 Tax=unclassified Streptomyces TaxID=2593676 RepID=UPI003CF6BEF1